MWVKFFAITLLFSGTQASLQDELGNIVKTINNTKTLFRLELDISDETKLALGYDEDTVLNFRELATKYGYETAEYTVTTEDGFISTLFRLWAGNCTSRGTPVLLMHGVLMTADAYIIAGPGKALGYLLADACHDVWVGNTRGNFYARNHTTLDPDVDKEFWQHSMDEIGQHDLPAIIDTVLAETNYTTLNYVGYSQGGGAVLIMCSENAEYCAKLNIIIGLAPGTRTLNTKFRGAYLLFSLYNYFEDILATLNIYETLFKGSILQNFLEFSCQMQGRIDLLYGLCKTFFTILDSANNGSISDDTFRVAYSKFPAGNSVRTIARWGQALKTKQFVKYDFGSEEANLAEYNSTTPPAYDLSKVTVPVAFLQGASDGVISPVDVLWAAAQLPQLLGVHIIEDPSWNHVDFMYSQYTSTYVLPTVLQYLSQYTTYV